MIYYLFENVIFGIPIAYSLVIVVFCLTHIEKWKGVGRVTTGMREELRGNRTWKGLTLQNLLSQTSDRGRRIGNGRQIYTRA